MDQKTEACGRDRDRDRQSIRLCTHTVLPCPGLGSDTMHTVGTQTCAAM